MSSVKKVEGTENYLNLAKERKLCQNEIPYQDCLAEEYSQKSFETCKCIPFRLNDFNAKVQNPEFPKLVSLNVY